jgi:hypothetical protein
MTKKVLKYLKELIVCILLYFIFWILIGLAWTFFLSYDLITGHKRMND